MAPWREQIDQLLQQNAYLKGALETRVAEPRGTKGPKIPPPGLFYGPKGDAADKDKLSYEAWSGQVRNYISMRPHEFPDERTKCQFAATYLRGPADEWVRPYMDSIHKGEPVAIFDKLDTFLESLAAGYGEADAVAAAENEIMALRQTGTVAEYAARYRALKVKTKWVADDKPWIAWFRYGLSNRFRTDLTLKKMPEDFDGYVKACCVYDDELRAIRATTRTNPIPQRTGTAFQTRQTSNSNQPRTGSSHRDPNAMEVDQISREEALRKGLCFHCGEKGHMSAKCPKRHASNTSNRTNVSTASTPQVPAPAPTASISDVSDETPLVPSGTTERPISVSDAAKVLMAHLSKESGFN